MKRPAKPSTFDRDLLEIPEDRSPARQRKKPRKHSSTIGETMTRLRVEAGFTQAELAEASGVSLKFIRKVEQGSTSVQLLLLQRLADFLGADVRLMARQE